MSMFAVRQVVARVADDDRRDRLRPGVRLVRGQDLLAVPLPPRVRRGKHEQRPARRGASRCRRPPPMRR